MTQKKEVRSFYLLIVNKKIDIGTCFFVIFFIQLFCIKKCNFNKND